MRKDFLKDKKWLKPLIIVLIIAVAVVGGYLIYTKTRKTKSVSSITYMKATVQKGNMEQYVTGSGNVSTSVSVDISSGSTGAITSLPVKEGDKVTKGQVIAKIDDSNAEADLTKAENSLKQQELSLEKLNKSLDALNVKSLVSGTVISVNISAGDDAGNDGKIYGSLLTIKTDDNRTIQINGYNGTITNVYVSANSRVSKGTLLFKLDDSDIQNSISDQKLAVQQAQSDCDTKETALNKMTITSPVDGVVAVENYKQGDTPEQGKAIITIIDPAQMQAVVQVDELDIASVKLGQTVNTTLDAIPNKTFSGQVIKIANIGSASNGVTTYDVTVSINSPDNIKVGMTANVNILVASRQDTLYLPIEAVQGTGTNRYVILPSATDSSSGSSSDNSSSNYSGSSRSNGSSGSYGMGRRNVTGSRGSIKRVTVGIMNEKYVEILSGLQEGDQVLIPVQTSTSTSSNQSSGFMSGLGGFGGSFGGRSSRSSSGSSSNKSTNSNSDTNSNSSTNSNNSSNGSNNSNNSNGGGDNR